MYPVKTVVVMVIGQLGVTVWKQEQWRLQETWDRGWELV